MLISYRDSKRYPSDALALQAWVKIAEAMARQVVCKEFDALQFARVLELCRRLTRRSGQGRGEAIGRMIHACASAGVAVVLVPNFSGCRASSASKWLGGGTSRVAMIALSLRYRRDDQLYFSFFREAGAILAAWKMGSGTIGRNGPVGCSAPMVPDPIFNPDHFARELLIPPEHDACLAEMAGIASASQMSDAVEVFAAKLGIAPGLVVGRMQHDGLIPWTYQNSLKREVDVSFVLRASEAVEETWPDQTMAARQVMRDFGLQDSPAQARERVRRAAASGHLLTNGQARKHLRLEPGRLAAWRLAMRDRDLDAEDAEGGGGEEKQAA